MGQPTEDDAEACGDRECLAWGGLRAPLKRAADVHDLDRVCESVCVWVDVIRVEGMCDTHTPDARAQQLTNLDA